MLIHPAANRLREQSLSIFWMDLEENQNQTSDWIKHIKKSCC